MVVEGIITPNTLSFPTASQAKYAERVESIPPLNPITSPFELDLSFSWKSGTQFEVTATANKVGTCNSSDVRVFIALTESHIQRAWQGMSELNYVVRDMIPTQNGTQMSGDHIEVTETFDIAAYDRENCELVAWVQSYNGTKEVYQAVKLSLMDSDNQYDMAIRSVEDIPIFSDYEMVHGRTYMYNKHEPY